MLALANAGAGGNCDAAADGAGPLLRSHLQGAYSVCHMWLQAAPRYALSAAAASVPILSTFWLVLAGSQSVQPTPAGPSAVLCDFFGRWMLPSSTCRTIFRCCYRIAEPLRLPRCADKIRLIACHGWVATLGHAADHSSAPARSRQVWSAEEALWMPATKDLTFAAAAPRSRTRDVSLKEKFKEWCNHMHQAYDKQVLLRCRTLDASPIVTVLVRVCVAVIGGAEPAAYSSRAPPLEQGGHTGSDGRAQLSARHDGSASAQECWLQEDDQGRMVLPRGHTRQGRPQHGGRHDEAVVPEGGRHSSGSKHRWNTNGSNTNKP
jgi:hypothetical protein